MNEIIERNRRAIAAAATDSAIVEDCKAWSVTRLAGVEMSFRHGDRVRVLIRGRWTEVQFGTVVGYALANDEDPIHAIERANELGHKHHWANLCSVALTSHAQEKESFIGLEFGETVVLEGVRFTLRPAMNGNVGLDRA